MSDLRIALVAEGATDLVIIEAALKAILAQPFLLQLLQPEPTRPEQGTGWGGVLKWCRSFQAEGHETLMADPKLELFDLIVLHLDVDVAHKRYADYGPEFAAAAANLLALPCARPCPPAVDTVIQLRAVVLGWLGIPRLGPQAVLCLPSKSSEAWLATALLPQGHLQLPGIECNLNAEGILATSLPKGKRVRKSRLQYQAHAAKITTAWRDVICPCCAQARQFEADVIAATLADGAVLAA